jgi:hypothetical protein
LQGKRRETLNDSGELKPKKKRRRLVDVSQEEPQEEGVDEPSAHLKDVKVFSNN